MFLTLSNSNTVSAIILTVNLLKLLLITAFFNALSWIILIPIWQYPDEQAHFAQVQDLAELGKVPTQLNTSYEVDLSEKIFGTDRDFSGINKFTYHPEFKFKYSNNTVGPSENFLRNIPVDLRKTLVKNEATLNPPLYYSLAAIFYKLQYNSDLFSRVYILRFMSLVIFLLTILVAVSVGNLIFSKDKFLAISLPTLMAFMPMFVFASTGILPDVLTNLFFTYLILVSLLLIKKGLKIIYIFLIIATVLLIVFTRQQFFIAILITGPLVIIQSIKTKKYLGTITVLTIIGVLLLILANTIGFSNRVLSHFRFQDLNILSFSKFSFSDLINYLQITLKHYYAETLPWYWGIYRWLSFTMPLNYYRIIKVIMILALVGLIKKSVNIALKRNFSQDDKYFTFLMFASSIYMFAFITWDYIFKLTNGYNFGIQGRYFFPIAIAHLSLMLIGLKELFAGVVKNSSKYLAFLMIVLMTLFFDISLIFVASSYYDFLPIKNFYVQVSQYKPIYLKGSIIPIILFFNLMLQLTFLYSFLRFIMAKSYERN